MNKNDLRKIMILKRKNISNKKELSKIITDKIINLDIYQKAKVVALYNSLNLEVDTRYIIDNALNQKIVLLPKVINDKMSFVIINKDTKYCKSEFGVLEPIGEIYNGLIDLIIIPGVAFDLEGNRLGYGKGYYDQYLSSINTYKIGICFSEQIVNNIPHNKLDIKMDQVISEK